MFIRLGIIAFIVIWESNGQEPCTTTTGSQGACISITECNPLLALLQKSKNLQSAQIETLKKSQCGFQGNTPKVCCPNDTQIAELMKDNSAGSPESNLVPVPPDVTKHPNLRLINDQSCGSVLGFKILQGIKAWIGQFPWMALIAYNHAAGNRTEFKCAGSLISKRYVLTAAHCITGLDPGLKLSGVRLGEHDLSQEQDCEGDAGGDRICSDKHQDFSIENFHVHSGYRKENYENDIALVRIDRDADLKPFNVHPICLPVGNNVDVKIRPQKAYSTGWGGIETGNNSRQLLVARMEILPNENCNSSQRNMSYKQICAGARIPLSMCAEDRGGPLQFIGFFNEWEKYIQYGVVSERPGSCAGAMRDPGVYTAVIYYMDWILDTILE